MAEKSEPMDGQPKRHAPAVILDRPQMGENIGAAARAMYNFALSEMRLIAPRDGWPNEKATAMASGADTVIDQVKVFPTLDEGLSGFHRIYATTARKRDLSLNIMSPREAVADMVSAIAGGRDCALLFGKEATGLDNDAMARVHVAINIPTNPGFSSLNLAQAVLLIGYEWWLSQGDHPVPEIPDGYLAPADHKDMQFYLERLEGLLYETGFLAPPEKAPAMMRNIRTLYMRMDPSDQDLRTLHGIISALIRKKAD